jgi:hypothetical protein
VPTSPSRDREMHREIWTTKTNNQNLQPPAAVREARGWQQRARELPAPLLPAVPDPVWRSGEGKIVWDLEAGGRGRRGRVRRLLIPATCGATYYIGVIGPHGALTAARMAKRAEMSSQQFARRDKPRGQIAASVTHAARIAGS